MIESLERVNQWISKTLPMVGNEKDSAPTDAQCVKHVHTITRGHDTMDSSDLYYTKQQFTLGKN